MSMDLGNIDTGIQHDLKDGLNTALDLGADVMKVGMDIARPRPRTGRKFDPRVMPYFEETIKRFKAAAPMTEEFGIYIAVENHCDSFSKEILWILKEVDHPFVGACIDTVNAWHMGENPMEAIENLSPVAFTNHFRDNLIEFHRDGFKVKGVATGDGDIDMEKAYELIKTNSPTNRINIETDMGINLEDKETALRLELETVKRCIDYCRNVLNIGKNKPLKT